MSRRSYPSGRITSESGPGRPHQGRFAARVSGDGEQAPGPRYPFAVVVPPVGALEVRPGHEVVHGGGDQDLPGTGEGRNPGTDGDGPPRRVVGRALSPVWRPARTSMPKAATTSHDLSDGKGAFEGAASSTTPRVRAIRRRPRSDSPKPRQSNRMTPLHEAGRCGKRALDRFVVDAAEWVEWS